MHKLVLYFEQYLNYIAILNGFTNLRIDYAHRKIYNSKLVNCYVLMANIVTVALLPCAHAIAINYITASFKNNLLAFTDSANLFVHYIVVVFSVTGRCRREKIYKQISSELFKLDRSYFEKLELNLRIEKRSNFVLFVKMCSVCAMVVVPIYGVFQQAIRVDANVIMLALYSGHIECILHGVIFLFFRMQWQVRKRMWRLNLHLADLLQRQQRLHRDAVGTLAADSDTLRWLSRLAADELREIARAHAHLSQMLLRLNRVYRWQVIAVLLTYLISNISYGYYWVVMMEASKHEHPSALSVLGSVVLCTVVFFDINLLYWAADATAHACQNTAYILREFQEPLLTDALFEQQYEVFALQLKQQKVDINIAGMFILNRQTALALWAFSARHILILVQFDYGARKQSHRSGGVLDQINRLLQFGENWAEQ
ncbi:putative gustatory receptor 36b [Rhagoletis pomonella]|uniref:putative gustatory receptor 36b n=1 Tax=Rhagoletis pomonella TaxID=28610 RepID=UPI001782933E|nr:putative gustatory receptor 36b [Rhagoletis pomonella]